MKQEILIQLVLKNIFGPSTEATILTKSPTLGGISMIETQKIVEVTQVFKVNNRYAFTGRSIVDGKNHHFTYKHILQIDGMDPVKLAGLYGIKADGSLKKPGRKRGRKPKAVA